MPSSAATSSTSFDGPDVVRLRDARLLAPVEPSKILGVGLNYRAHAAEMGKQHPRRAAALPQAALGALLAPGDADRAPGGYERVDYEGELAVVIGRRARRVRPRDALDYVLGFTILNDVTVRDLQKKDVQYTRAKGFDTFAPCGPCVETWDLDPSRTSASCTARERRGAAGLDHRGPDLLRRRAGRVRQPRDDARARRPHHHRHAAGRRPALARRRRRDRDRGNRHPPESRRRQPKETPVKIELAERIRELPALPLRPHRRAQERGAAQGQGPHRPRHRRSRPADAAAHRRRRCRRPPPIRRQHRYPSYVGHGRASARRPRRFIADALRRDGRRRQRGARAHRLQGRRSRTSRSPSSTPATSCWCPTRATRSTRRCTRFVGGEVLLHAAAPRQRLPARPRRHPGGASRAARRSCGSTTPTTRPPRWPPPASTNASSRSRTKYDIIVASRPRLLEMYYEAPPPLVPGDARRARVSGSSSTRCPRPTT